jgi:hypothetical protein
MGPLMLRGTLVWVWGGGGVAYFNDLDVDLSNFGDINKISTEYR